MSNINKRLIYISGFINEYDTLGYSTLFHSEWKVIQSLTRRLCDLTKEDLQVILPIEIKKLVNSKLLINSLSLIVEFEQKLDIRFQVFLNNFSKKMWILLSNLFLLLLILLWITIYKQRTSIYF